MSKVVQLTLALLLATSLEANAQSNTPVPCACPQWLFGTDDDGNGNVIYHYYAQYCDGVNAPYWNALDTSTDHGEYPSGSCTNEDGCTDPAVPQFAGNAAAGPAPGAGKGAPKPMVVSINGIEKNASPTKKGLGGKGSSPLTGIPWNANVTPTIDTNGGVEIGPAEIAEIEVGVGSKARTIYAKVYKYTLTPSKHKLPIGKTWNVPANAPSITIGKGFQIKKRGITPDFTVSFDDLRTISPDPHNWPHPPSTFTFCLRFDRVLNTGTDDEITVEYQVVTSNPILIK